MNNPKLKAKELFNKMINTIPSNQNEDINRFIELDIKSAKQCALIAAENSRTEMISIQNYERAIYYRDVKQEIRNL